MAWDDRYESRYGYWRPYIMDVIYRYLDCGDVHFGFARVKCAACGHEYLLAYSCKRRYFWRIAWVSQIRINVVTHEIKKDESWK
jgi:hypothetical protein